MPVVPSGSLILVTGINGHIGSTLVVRLLESGFRVRGTVRSLIKGDKLTRVLHSKFSDLSNKFELVEILNFESADDYGAAMGGVAGVLHIASPNTMDQTSPETQVVPAVRGTLAILQAAAATPSVARVTLIGTVGSVIMNNKPPGEKTDATDWNVLSPKAVKNPEDPAIGFHCYVNSKLKAEKAAWEFVKNHSVGFDLNVVLPSIALGPVFNEINGPPRPDVSLGNLWDFLGNRKPFAAPSINVLLVHSYDVADCMIRSLTAPQAINQRFICTGGKTSWAKVCDLLREAFPDRTIPPTNVDAYVPQFPGAEDIEFDLTPAEVILGIKWRSIEDAVIDASRDLLARSDAGWD